MADTCPLSRAGEARLRTAFGLIRSWTPEGLSVRLRKADIGVPSVIAAQILISRGHSAGLLVRSGGQGSAYTLNADWQHPSGRPAVTLPAPEQESAKARPRRADAFALLGQIPAQRPGPLTPSLGARSVEGVDADGELLPCIGGRIVDALHGQFQAMFGTLE